MVRDTAMNNVPSLIVIGGFPGSGKTTISSKLSYELGVPRLSSDAIGHTIKDSVDPTDICSKGFYGTIGFVELDPADVPYLLQEKLDHYRTMGLDSIIMARIGERC